MDAIEREITSNLLGDKYSNITAEQREKLKKAGNYAVGAASKVGEALGYRNTQPAQSAPPTEPKKILNMKPLTFWMIVGGVALTTIVTIAVLKNK